MTSVYIVESMSFESYADFFISFLLVCTCMGGVSDFRSTRLEDVFYGQSKIDE